MPRGRTRRRILMTTQRDLMMAAASHCRTEACNTMGEVGFHSEVYRRLDAVTNAIDDLMALPEMAGDREHLWLKPHTAAGR